MRASSLALLAALAAGGFGWSVQAQTSPPAPQPASDQPKKDGDKGSQKAKETGTNHVDALSRDETRRLERLRARTTAAPKEAVIPAKQGEMPKGDERPSSRAAKVKAASAAEQRTRSLSARRAPRRTRDASEASRPRGRASDRSASREVADRAPRVGDVVPSNIPLYPLGARGDRVYPPFPRVNGYTQRRVFEEPDD